MNQFHRTQTQKSLNISVQCSTVHNFHYTEKPGLSKMISVVSLHMSICLQETEILLRFDYNIVT